MNIKELIDAATNRSAKTQAEIAEELGISPARVSEWKSGKRKPDAGEIAFFAERAGLSVFETVAELEKQLRPAYAPIWDRALATGGNWRKRSNPPRLRLHQARQKRTREAPKFGAFSFVSPKRRMAGLVRAVNRALYRTLTQPHRLGNPRHRHAIGVHA